MGDIKEEMEFNNLNKIESNNKNYIELNTEEENIEKKEEKTKKEKIKKYGNLILIYLMNSNKPKIVIGPDWKFFIIGFICLIIYSFLIFYILLFHSNIYLKIIGFIIIVLELLFYILSFLVDPGIQLKRPNDKNLNHQICLFCGVIKYNNVNQFHCDECNACIIGYDHHCPWIGKCVGKNNLFYFRMFIFSVFANFAYIILIISTIDFE